MNTIHRIDGKTVSPAVREQMDQSVVASFEDDQVQANLATDNFTFILEAYDRLKQQIDEGRILEPVPYTIEAVDSGQYTAFDGWVALWKEHRVNPFASGVEATPNISAKLQKQEGLNSLFEDLEALDWDFLRSEGALSPFKNYEYTVKNYYSMIELLMIAGQAYAFAQALAESTYKTAKATLDLVDSISKSVADGGTGASIRLGVQAGISAAYSTAIGAALFALINDMVRTYLIPKRNGKCQCFGVLMQDALAYLGYTLRTDITQLFEWVITPSNPNLDSFLDGFIKTPQGPERGYPRIGDPGFVCLEFFQIMQGMFNARMAVKDGEVWFYRALNPIWKKNSTYRMPRLEAKPYSHNTEELLTLASIKFTIDYTDIETLNRFSDGVHIRKFESQGEFNTLSAVDRTTIPYALVGRKNENSALESALESFFTAANLVLAVFGKKIGAKFSNKIGAVQTSTNNWTVPKVFPLSGEKLPSDFGKLNAAELWDKFHFDKSPMAEGRQRLKYSGVTVPFGLADFNKTIDNSYMTTIDGRPGKIESLEWTINEDEASMSYYIEEQYTDRITEKIVSV